VLRTELQKKKHISKFNLQNQFVSWANFFRKSWKN